MGDYRQFLRYLTPGLFFVILLFSLFLVSNYQRTVDVLPVEYGKASGLAIPVVGLLVSGGIGYALAIAYHWLLWTWRGLFAAGHDKLLSSLEDAELLHLVVRGEEPSKTGEPATPAKPSKTEVAPRLSGIGAWTVLNVLWRRRMIEEDGKRTTFVACADERMQALSDVAHSAGAAFVASVLAVLIFLGVYWQRNLSEPWVLWRPAVLGAFAVIVTYMNALRVVGTAYRFADSVLYEDVVKNIKKDAPLTLSVGVSQLWWGKRLWSWASRLCRPHKRACLLLAIVILVSASATLGVVRRGEGMVAKIVLTVGLLFDIAGFLFITRGLFISKKDALSLGLSRIAANTEEEQLRQAGVKDRLRQSKNAIIGAVLVVIGLTAQVVAAWL